MSGVDLSQLHVYIFLLNQIKIAFAHAIFKLKKEQVTLKLHNTGELGYDGLNGTRKIGPSYAKSVVYI